MVATRPKQHTLEYGKKASLRAPTDGASWSQTNNALYPRIFTLAIDPTDSTVYAGTGYGGLYRSIDGGQSWSRIGVRMPAGFELDDYKKQSASELRVMSIAVDPLHKNTIYAGTTPYGFLRSGVFKTTDGGMSWSFSNRGLRSSSISSIAINPTNTNIVYVGTSAGVFKSTDAGSKWSEINNGLTNRTVVKIALDPTDPNTIYAATNGGVFKSTDGGRNWSEANTGLIGYRTISLAINPVDTNTVYVGTAGNSVFVSYDGGCGSKDPLRTAHPLWWNKR